MLELDSVWRSYLARLSEADLADVCSYTNSKGDAFTSKVIDILNQLILHAVHHRGQISLEIRRTGLCRLKSITSTQSARSCWCDVSLGLVAIVCF